MKAKLRLRTSVSAPFDENTYLVGLPDRPEVLIVDPGFQPELIMQQIEDEELKPVAILNTHGHVDHIAGNAAMKRRFPDIPIIIGFGDALMLTDANLNLSARSEEHTSELQSLRHLVCRLLLEK